MCGRFSMSKDQEKLLKEFPFVEKLSENIEPSYNIAPGQDSLVILESRGRLKLSKFKWGLIPSWMKKPKNGYGIINAKAETVAEKPSFKTPFRLQRCLVVADGFYEWARTNGKNPFRITLKEKELFSFAGLWDRWYDGQKFVYTFAIITCPSNKLISSIHNRMPVILSKQNELTWLNQKTDEKKLKELLVPYDSSLMDMYRVSSFVNNWRNNSSKCFERIL